MRALRHRRNRRAHAVLAAVLWLLGVEVLPNLHLASHADDHTHDATTGAIVRVTFAEPAHAHADGTVHVHASLDDNGAPAKRRTNGEHAFADDDVPNGHAAAGLAHRALALSQPPPPALAPLALPPNEFALAPVVAHLDSRALARPTARGPPVA
jgi:hypothetical protein